jgi:hypothetical protein
MIIKMESRLIWQSIRYKTRRLSVLELLREKFPGHVISRNGDQNWPPKSCDLTPCDFFLWGVCEISCQCQQTTNNSWAQGGCSTRHWRNWSAVIRKCHREFPLKSKSEPAESWGTFVEYCVPQLIAVCVLYTEIKISVFLMNGAFYYKIKSCAIFGTPCIYHHLSFFTITLLLIYVIQF